METISYVINIGRFYFFIKSELVFFILIFYVTALWKILMLTKMIINFIGEMVFDL